MSSQSAGQSEYSFSRAETDSCGVKDGCDSAPASGVVVGALAGFAATFPMTAVMGAGYRALPAGERYSLPPRQITMSLARSAGVAESMDNSDRTVATAVAHFGYGAAMGGIYGLLTHSESRSAATGAVLGGCIRPVRNCFDNESARSISDG